MLKVSKNSISFVGSLQAFLAALDDAVKRNRPGMTLVEYCRERTSGKPG
jgi:hypothetical protein